MHERERQDAEDQDRLGAVRFQVVVVVIIVVPALPPFVEVGVCGVITIPPLVDLLLTGDSLALVFILVPVMIALTRVVIFWRRMRSADPAAPARLPDRAQLLALRCVRERGAESL